MARKGSGGIQPSMIEQPAIGMSFTCARTPDGSGDARRLVEWARGLGVRWVQLDATAPGMRARELDRSGRRDLASVIRRSDLGLTGLDLFIPPSHFVERVHQDRAVAALCGAIELAGELAGLLGSAGSGVVAVSLPATVAADVVWQVESAASKAGVAVADHHRPARATDGPSLIGIGIDPAAVISAGEDLFDTLTRMAGPVAQARLSDAAGGLRVVPGSGDGGLDLVEYVSALGVLGYGRPVIADLRGLRDPTEAAGRMISAWRRVPGIGAAG